MAQSWTPGSTEFGRIDKGYWITTPNFVPDEGGDARNAANAFLEDISGNRVFMWVNELTSDFAMNGLTAQSKKRRSFFPHNFVQPSMTIAGQTPNQYQYARIAEFVRKSQREAVIHDRHVLKFRCIATAESTVRPIIKGAHESISVDGYVQSMPRVAERFVNAPPFSFSFIITKANHFLNLTDTAVRRVKFKSILDVVLNPEEFTFEEGGVYNPNSPNDRGPDHSGGSTSGSGVRAGGGVGAGPRPMPGE